MADTTTAGTFVIYRHLTASGPEYRWRLRDTDGRTLARSATGHRERSDLEREMRPVVEAHPGASVLDPAG
jgi:uncharacterized protein YegP (UPF0339 family)